MVYCYVFSAIMLIAGLVFFTGKGAPYIKGYTSMTEDEKKNIDIKALCRNLGVVLMLLAAVLAAAGYSEPFRLNGLRWAMIGWMVLCCADVLYINKSKRYVKQDS